MCEQIPTYVKLILDEIISNENFSKFSIVIGSGQSEGDGFASIILRLSIIGSKHDGTNAKLAIIVKLLPTDQNIIDKFYVEDRFKREVFFYNQILPEFEKIQKENGIFGRIDGFYAYPKCYYANYDEVQKRGVLILEDLIDSGYRMHGTSDYLVRDFDQLDELAIELGRFHAISFALQKLKPDVWREFLGLNDLLTIMMTTDFMTSLAEKNIQLALEVIDPNDGDKIKEIKNLENGMWTKMSKLTNSQISEPFNVINHGDCWFNNIMYQYNVSYLINYLKLIILITTFKYFPIF